MLTASLFWRASRIMATISIKFELFFISHPCSYRLIRAASSICKKATDNMTRPNDSVSARQRRHLGDHSDASGDDRGLGLSAAHPPQAARHVHFTAQALDSEVVTSCGEQSSDHVTPASAVESANRRS